MLPARQSPERGGSSLGGGAWLDLSSIAPERRRRNAAVFDASGLTSSHMLVVLNSRMKLLLLGAFFGFQITRWVGFLAALFVAPCWQGRRCCSRAFWPSTVHRNGLSLSSCYVAWLCDRGLFKSSWQEPGRFRIPASAAFPAFMLLTNYPAYKISCCWFLSHLLALLWSSESARRLDRSGSPHPSAYSGISVKVGRIFMRVFGVVRRSPPSAGVIAAPRWDAGERRRAWTICSSSWSLEPRSSRRLCASLLIGLVHTLRLDDGSLAGAFARLVRTSANRLSTSGALRSPISPVIRIAACTL